MESWKEDSKIITTIWTVFFFGNGFDATVPKCSDDFKVFLPAFHRLRAAALLDTIWEIGKTLALSTKQTFEEVALATKKHSELF